jgi:hypothetical protein|tara:strand:+ start:343 stop:453 length:111 start_codon:yes stop_codon:yes gene_type:complete
VENICNEFNVCCGFEAENNNEETAKKTQEEDDDFRD